MFLDSTKKKWLITWSEMHLLALPAFVKILWLIYYKWTSEFIPASTVWELGKGHVLITIQCFSQNGTTSANWDNLWSVSAEKIETIVTNNWKGRKNNWLANFWQECLFILKTPPPLTSVFDRIVVKGGKGDYPLIKVNVNKCGDGNTKIF